MARCSNCNSLLQADSAQCYSCGYRLESELPAQPNEMSAPSAPPPSGPSPFVDVPAPTGQSPLIAAPPPADSPIPVTAPPPTPGPIEREPGALATPVERIAPPPQPTSSGEVLPAEPTSPTGASGELPPPPSVKLTAAAASGPYNYVEHEATTVVSTPPVRSSLTRSQRVRVVAAAVVGVLLVGLGATGALLLLGGESGSISEADLFATSVETSTPVEVELAETTDAPDTPEPANEDESDPLLDEPDFENEPPLNDPALQEPMPIAPSPPPLLPYPAIQSIATSTQRPDSTDACEDPVSYQPWNLYDGDPTTAWMTPGNGIGQTIQINLAQRSLVREVGLIPGYDKFDPCSKSDRFFDLRRVTSVRWSFDDGSSVVQNFGSGRQLQMISLGDGVATSTVRITILSTTQPGLERLDHTPISEIAIR